MLEAITWGLTALTALFGIYFAAIALLGGLRKAKHYPRRAPKNRICALIAARNEEQVVGLLVDSLMKQHYPRELFEVCVVPNNCTDDTQGAAQRAGARILPCTQPVHSKGEVVRLALDQLMAEQPGYDAFCIFDADNLVDPDFFLVVNDALCAGEKIAQGYRDSKNPGDSWVAGCVSVFYWGMNRLYNRARDCLGMSAALNGTGFMMSSQLIREIGFDTHSLTEDLEYSAQCALNGTRIGWMNDAVVYDEQPIRFRDSYVQRRRWSAGTFQCMKRYCLKLFGRAIARRDSHALDMAVLFTGPLTQLICLIPCVIFAVDGIRQLIAHQLGMGVLAAMLGVGLINSVLGGGLMALAVCLMENKMARERWSALAGMWLFLLSWIPANLMSLVSRPPRWTQIPHTSAVRLDHLEEKNGTEESQDQSLSQ